MQLLPDHPLFDALLTLRDTVQRVSDALIALEADAAAMRDTMDAVSRRRARVETALVAAMAAAAAAAVPATEPV